MMWKPRHKAYKSLSFLKAGVQVLAGAALAWFCLFMGTGELWLRNLSPELKIMGLVMTAVFSAVLFKTDCKEEMIDD